MGLGNLWLTAPETVAVVARCEPKRQPLTYARLRYWDDEGIVPAARLEQGASRLYCPEDVAMVRLALRVLASGRSLRQVSEALRYRHAEIRAAFHAAGRRVLTFTAHGLADVRPARETDRASDVYVLRDCFEGVERMMREHRRGVPELWAGWSYVPAPLVSSAAPRYEVDV